MFDADCRQDALLRVVHRRAFRDVLIEAERQSPFGPLPHRRLCPLLHHHEMRILHLLRRDHLPRVVGMLAHLVEVGLADAHLPHLQFVFHYLVQVYRPCRPHYLLQAVELIHIDGSGQLQHLTRGAVAQGWEGPQLCLRTREAQVALVRNLYYTFMPLVG